MCDGNLANFGKQQREQAVENIPVKLNGKRLIWIKEDNTNGPLAYPDHLDDDGHVKLEHAFTSDSYAHICDGVILRYRKVIGSIDDLVFGES